MRARSYLAGLAVVFVSAYLQYLVKLNFTEDLLLVYGLPCLVISLLCGRQIISKAFNQTKLAIKFALGYFGAFVVAGILLSAIVLAIIITLDPNALSLLEQPNPVLNVSPAFAQLMIILSFVIVGPTEEYIFRGFVYGGLLNVFNKKHWITLAFISSLLFAAVHFYYVEVYGIASIIPFIVIISFGMAMAVTYYLSGGNLIGPALIHGAFDATGFIGVASSMSLGVELKGALIIAGVVTAAIIFAQRGLRNKEKAGLAAPQPNPQLTVQI
jgi:membrane protease YdiL (CAAX protease family)